VLGFVVGGMLTALVVCAAMKKALSRKHLGYLGYLGAFREMLFSWFQDVSRV
jgi:hypothetical protein